MNIYEEFTDSGKREMVTVRTSEANRRPKIKWSCLGFVSIEYAKEFRDLLSVAIDKAERK